MATNNPTPPNIDQRIEALTHSVELLSQMHQDSEKRYNRMFEQLVTVTEQLAHIAENHERRLKDLGS